MKERSDLTTGAAIVAPRVALGATLGRTWELFLRLAPNHNILRLDKPAELSRLIELSVRAAFAFEKEAPHVAERLAGPGGDVTDRPRGDAAR